MNKREAIRQTHQENTLMELGFTREECAQLRRISMTLRRWFEHECNGTIQRGEDGIARGYRVNASYLDPHDPRYWYSVPDRETGARKRLAAIMGRVNGHAQWCASVAPLSARGIAERGPCNCHKPKAPLAAYVQTDPRGAALYILRPGDVPEGGDVSAYYTRGVCVY